MPTDPAWTVFQASRGGPQARQAGHPAFQDWEDFMRSSSRPLRRRVFPAVVYLFLAVGLLISIAPLDVLAWDAGTTSRAHQAAPETGGENPISILDTRPKWAVSVDTNSSRVADCPVGYTNNGATCGRGADTISAPSLLATCPTGYVNTGSSCYRAPYIYDAPSKDPLCPSGYTYTGVSCYRAPYIYSAPSRLATCPAGYVNTGVSCFRAADSYGRSYKASCSGTDIGLICSGGTYSCPNGGSLSAGYCYLSCRAGYVNTGLTCLRNADTISLANASCPSGYFKGVADRCYQTCASGFTNTGEFCNRGADTIALTDSSVTCSSGYFKGATGRCNMTCNSGFTNTGEFCHRDASTLPLASSASCPSGYFLGLLGRCNKTCPQNYTNTGETCFRPVSTLTASSMTCLANEQRIEIAGIPRCYSKPVCPAGYDYFALRCYVAASATGLGGSVERTAVSTIVHNVKQSGNTHLWIVIQALDLLQKEDPAGITPLGAFVKELRTSPSIRQAWEQGLWDADTPDYADADGHQGTHFYNPALKDRYGRPTPWLTYFPVIKNSFACTNSYECASEQLKNMVGYALGETNPRTQKLAAYHLGLALHYLTDATQPMHTSGWSGFDIPTNGHPQWEYYVPQIQHKFTVAARARNPRFLDWEAKNVDLDHPSIVFRQAALRSNLHAPRLADALHVDGAAGIVTIEAFNGIGPYTGYNFYNDSSIDDLTGEILQEAYQSTAAYLAAVWKTHFQTPQRRTCDVDGNGSIDRLDLNAILAARNAPADGATDPRDADGNGTVDINDARLCALRCTAQNCASR
ncbi:hypothetical protein [Pelomonas cellulosilytica]|uniref:Zn-dependent PLC domain-containing protein n=1 Tax=Pelomonas cellulosilytica TaxID=2906762 RepID=A0ABS8XZI7_9BURK|nr:hypothetical protein [Pelomonas sp. P8]MCE4558026.1 hypothetical protein [Pelomonas sp. P8]